MTANRFSMIVVAVVIAALAVLTISMATSPSRPVVSNSAVDSYSQIEIARAARYEAAAAQQAYMDQRRGEWTTGQAVSVAQAKLSFRQAEQLASAGDAQHAYIVYREGEWNAGVSPAQAYLNYRRGEWTGK